MSDWRHDETSERFARFAPWAVPALVGLLLALFARSIAIGLMNLVTGAL